MKEYIFGGISGVCQTIIGFPFDTYKVRIQNNQFKIRDIFRINPYNGVKYPLISSVITCSMTFGTNTTLQGKYHCHPIISGAVSGILISPVIFYFDFKKINRQMNTNRPFTLIHNGFSACISREAFAFSIYFYAFHILNEEYKLNTYLSGGIAGLANWTSTFPIDVIKTRQLTYNVSILQAIKMGGLWNGYVPCAIRALLVNSSGFYVYKTLYDLYA